MCSGCSVVVCDWRVWWWWWWWWWCGPVCNDACLSMTTHEMHLIMGPCPCGHDPGPAPECRARKTHPIAHQRDDEPPDTAKTTTSATMGARLSPPRVHSRTAGPRNRDIGHRDEQLENVHGQTNSLDHGLATAPRRGSEPNEQELWEDDCSTHNLHVRTCTTSTKGTSAIVSTSNWGIFMVF